MAPFSLPKYYSDKDEKNYEIDKNDKKDDEKVHFMDYAWGGRLIQNIKDFI
jgi:hypothetical protein